MAWTQRILDHFTVDSDTALQDHTPDQGGAWSIRVGSFTCFAAGDFLVGGTTKNVATNAQTLEPKQAAAVGVQEVNGFPAPCVRCAWDGSNLTGYAVLWNGATDFELYKFTGSGTTTSLLTSSAGTLDNFDNLRLEADGSTLTVLKNSVQQFQHTDSSYATGIAGIWSNIDNCATVFEAYDEASSPVGAKIIFRNRDYV